MTASASRLRALAAAGLLTLAGCSVSPVDKDGGPSRPPVDVSRIPDAVPKAEPRTRAGNPPSYVIRGKRYHVLQSSAGFSQRGVASWYGNKFHGRKTSNGERYDMYAMTAAHKTLPIPSYVEVTNLANGRRIVVRVNDRGPFVRGRIIDLSYTAAAKLDILAAGTAPVRIRTVGPGDLAVAAPVIPSKATVTATVTATIQTAGSITIQAGAFGVLANAERLRDRLIAAALGRVRIDRSRRLYHVRIGPLAAGVAADLVVRYLAALGIAEPVFIVD